MKMLYGICGGVHFQWTYANALMYAFSCCTPSPRTRSPNPRGLFSGRRELGGTRLRLGDPFSQPYADLAFEPNHRAAQTHRLRKSMFAHPIRDPCTAHANNIANGGKT